MNTPLEIIKRPVTRYFAQYVNSRGDISHKGFNTKRRAAMFTAKEWLLDQIFGEKVHHSTSSCEWGWYSREVDWDLHRMKYIFNCQWTAETGTAGHMLDIVGMSSTWEPIEGDQILCTDSGKAFCALAWKNEVKRIAAMILNGEQPTVSDWIIERNNEYDTSPERLAAANVEAVSE